MVLTWIKENGLEIMASMIVIVSIIGNIGAWMYLLHMEREDREEK